MSEKTDSMSFLEHLEVLRGHLIRSAISILVFTIAAFFFKEFIFDSILLTPKNADFITNRLFCQLGHLMNTEKLCINTQQLELQSIELAGQFRVHLKISFFAGLILAFPYFIYELWRFIEPALKVNEKKHANGNVFYSSTLFMLGVCFGYFLIVPLTVNFLGGYEVSSQVDNNINIKSYISTVTTLCLSTGLVFELPIIVFFLSKVGVLTPDLLRKYRKHSIVVFFILAGIITPPDVISQILVCLPLFVLYEISIGISRRIEKKREKELDEI
ncbi:twin-arginine translocase subunit TatC [Bacteroidota bacterium]